MMLGYKIMRLKGRRLVSGADSRLSFPARIGSRLTVLGNGSRLTVLGNGLYLSTNKQYVIDYYSMHDREVLLTVEFDLADIVWGRQTLGDREPELGVRHSRIVRLEKLK